MHSLAEVAGSQIGSVFERIVSLFTRAGGLNHLDGLVSLWHPEKTQ
jgi:hypothetical protein